MPVGVGLLLMWPEVLFPSVAGGLEGFFASQEELGPLTPGLTWQLPRFCLTPGRPGAPLPALSGCQSGPQYADGGPCSIAPAGLLQAW